MFGFTSCCLLCLSVAVTPGYFCCRGTSLLLYPPLSLTLTQSDNIPPPCQYSNSKSIDQLQIHLLTAPSLYVCEFRGEGACGDVSVSCQLVSCFSFSFGRAWSLRFFLCVPDEHRKIKKARTGCGQTGFLILLQAALKRVCSWGTNYRLYLAYGEEIIWCVAN